MQQRGPSVFPSPSPIGWRSGVRVLSPICYLLSAIFCLAQPQQAWVARYNGGFTNKTHTPLAMKLDNAGNIYVAGSSQNASNLYDYVVLKYAPNGTQLYAARYSPTNGATYPANGFALDQNGNTYLTGGIIAQFSEPYYPKRYMIGNGATVKFDTNGRVAWAAPYTGNDVAVDTNGNVYVTGFSTTEYATAKLDASGSNLWTRTYVGVAGPDNPVSVSQKMAVDNAGNVYVAGWADYNGFYYPGHTNLTYYSHPVVLMYDALGNPVWTSAYEGVGGIGWGQTEGLIPDNQGNVYVTGNGDSTYMTAKVNAGGQRTWGYLYGAAPDVTSMAIDTNGNVYLTGGIYLTAKLYSTNGGVAWETYQQSDQANGIILDNNGNIYVVGVLSGNSNGNDFALIKYDNTNGNQQWVIRYNGPANGNDGATAIAVAPDGSIYVTGYSANANGGSDITTIKYGNLTNIQKKSDGSIQLQFFGSPGQGYNFQATTDFLNWTNLGSSLADTNGMFEFLDTNAPLFPFRFYRWYYPVP